MTSVPTPINPRVERAPYYIVAPRYIGTSAGIRALHLLCHWLNLKGERAFMALQYVELGPNVSFDLQTPILTPEIVDYHYQQGLQPIVIYPEVVAGNPLEADCVVRWLLNFPGLLGGTTATRQAKCSLVFPKHYLILSVSMCLYYIYPSLMKVCSTLAKHPSPAKARPFMQ